jgi:hypothetical protein
MRDMQNKLAEYASTIEDYKSKKKYYFTNTLIDFFSENGTKESEN